MRQRNRVRELLTSKYGVRTSIAALDEIDAIYGVLPDDDEQVTSEWLESLGCDFANAPCGSGWFNQIGVADVAFGVIPNPGEPSWCLDVFLRGDGEDEIEAEVTIQEFTTRGEFRRLCLALGIERKAGAT